MTPHPQEPDASDAELPGGGNAVQVSAEDATHLRALVAAMLETVLRTREPHRMPVQRYDLRRPTLALATA